MPHRFAPPSSRLLFLVLAVAVTHTNLAAQEQETPDGARQERSTDEPLRALEFAISGDALQFGYRSAFHRGNGYNALGLLISDEDDFALQGRLMRFGEPLTDTPLGLGVGLGLFGARVDESDSELFAITLCGAADYQITLDYPVRIGVEASYAPAKATFSDGERVLDLLGRVEVDLSSWATAFAGYRHLEVDIEDEDDPELDSSVLAGVRLGF